jgi:hypothetical protein
MINVAKLTAHLMLLKNLRVWYLFVFLVLGLPLLCPAQEIEPRRWGHLPIGTNFAGAGYYYTEADIYLDPVLQIENVKMELHTYAVKYIRTFELLQKSARIDFTQGFQEGRWEGLVAGVPSSIKRTGLSDTLLRFAMYLYGAPALKGEKFAAYRSKADVETIVGTALVVQLPTGNYMEDKLINLGSNRFTFRPQLGMVHSRGKWSLELTGAVWLYTDNNDFLNGYELEQDPLYTLQTHLVYIFRPGLWAAASVGYAYGGESTLSGEEKNDLKENLAWALSLGYPVTRRVGVKVAYVGLRTQRAIGQDSDSFFAGISFLW